jgi:DNA-binding NtrC family response regulator/tetratricopeptide (TPR) repeat protein
MLIEHNPRFDSAFRAIDTGRIGDAKALLDANRSELRRIDGELFGTVASHVAFHAGNLRDAAQLAVASLGGDRPLLVAWANCTLADIAAAQNQFKRSQDHFLVARRQVQEVGSIPARAFVELRHWSVFSGLVPLARASSEFAQVRRLVYGCGHPNYLVEMRLLAARFESRMQNVIEAQRHWDIAQATLRMYRNRKLEGETALDACLLAFLRNDLIAAREQADLARGAGKDSGDFRLRAGADINAAHILCLVGELPAARALMVSLVPHLADHVRLRIAALDCLANVALSEGNLTEAIELFDEVSNISPTQDGAFVLHWDRLSVLATRAELKRRLNDLEASRALLEEAVALAESNRDSVWLARTRSSLGLLLLEMGDRTAAESIFERLVTSADKVPEIVARTSQLSSALMARDAAMPMGNAATRPARIAEALGNHFLMETVPSVNTVAATASPVFNDAAALIELAGYPHVLAREAFALLSGAQVAERLALVARGADGVRVLSSVNWETADAARAAANPADRLQIVCGPHRDETWEVIAELKPSLADRCTAVAVRQLVDTAVTLDHYRREEKQRTALWPADSFETDGGLFMSEQMSDLLAIARRVAPADITVLLTGETGTGKEVLARAIHRASPRAAKPFVPFNCTAVPRDMLESQLFGYRKGAFTGADVTFEGVIRGAAGGTLFLDEIAEIGPDVQPKLLRFLETHEVHGLGEQHPVKVDVRLLAATNADIEAMVADGRFREDLFYRLNVIRLKLPPLRERREEIPPLIDHYLRKAAEELRKGRLSLDDETLEYLLLYAWPGNVRQLVNEIRRIAAFAEPDSVITPALLSPEIQASRRTVRVADGDSPEVRVHLDQPMGDALEAIEQAMVRRALERSHGNYETAARLLGISRKGLFLKRRRWGMQRAS